MPSSFPPLEWQDNRWVTVMPRESLPEGLDLSRLPRPRYLLNQAIPNTNEYKYCQYFYVRRITLSGQDNWWKVPRDERTFETMYYNGRICYTLSDDRTYGHYFTKMEADMIEV